MATVDELIRTLQSSGSYKERRDAASALGRLADPIAVPALLRTLKNDREDTEVRAATANTIGQIGDLYATTDICQDDSSKTRNAKNSRRKSVSDYGENDGSR